jgi:hypothetical protein
VKLVYVGSINLVVSIRHSCTDKVKLNNVAVISYYCHYTFAVDYI